MKAVFRTDKGKVRQHNEDNGGFFYNQANQSLAIVADGMGGHRAGDVASEMTILKLKRIMGRNRWKLRLRIRLKTGLNDILIK